MKETWTLLFDVDRCNGCCNCVLATLDEYVDNRHEGYSAAMPKHGSRWYDLRTIERGAFPAVDVAYVPMMCMHCDEAPCIPAGRGAVRRREDGIVIIDPLKAQGRRDLVDACPHGAIHWNEAEQLPQAWTMDAHLLDAGWKEPRAAQACPTGAFSARRMTADEVGSLSDQGFTRPDEYAATGARLFIRGLHRLTSALIGGSVSQTMNGIEEPVVGVVVHLRSNNGCQAQTVTDDLGGFRFDRLPPLKGDLTLSLHHNGTARSWEIREHPQHPGRYEVGVLSI